MKEVWRITGPITLAFYRVTQRAIKTSKLVTTLCHLTSISEKPSRPGSIGARGRKTYNRNNLIAIITARGGSKGLPGKNIKMFLGLPLIAHTIVAAKDSHSIERVIVSTDCEKIASIARRYGAEVPFTRPQVLASDTATSRDVILHALENLEAESKKVIETFCILQPTSPLRNSQDIDAAVQIFTEKSADSVISIASYEHPIQWAISLRNEDQIVAKENFKNVRRQDLEPYFRPNGAIYLFRKGFYMRASTSIGGNSFGYIMPSERSIDIDTEYDFVTAEAVGKYLLDNSSHG